MFFTIICHNDLRMYICLFQVQIPFVSTENLLSLMLETVSVVFGITVLKSLHTCSRILPQKLLLSLMTCSRLTGTGNHNFVAQ